MAKKSKRRKAPKPRNRRAQDTTLINLDALKKRVTKLEAIVKRLQGRGGLTGPVQD